MTSLVPTDKIEWIVGKRRHATEHWLRISTADSNVYILHSAKCKDSGIDLRDCPFSMELDDWGIDEFEWEGLEDQPIIVDLNPIGGLLPRE